MDNPIIKLTPDSTEEDAVQQVEAWIVEWTTTTLKVDQGRIGPDTVLMELGLDSVDAVFMLSELEAMLQIKLDTSLLLECPTGRALAPRVARVWAARDENPPAA